MIDVFIMSCSIPRVVMIMVWFSLHVVSVL